MSATVRLAESWDVTGQDLRPIYLLTEAMTEGARAEMGEMASVCSVTIFSMYVCTKAQR